MRSLRRAHEERDVELALSLYAEHAEVCVFDHTNPPDCARVFKGKAQIAEYLGHLYGQEMTHRVGAALHDVGSGEARISFDETSVSEEVRRRLSARS